MKHAPTTAILAMASAAVSTLCLAQAVPSTGPAPGAAPQGVDAFLAADLSRGVFRSGDQVARAWGTLASGATPSESGRSFIDSHARGVFGVDPSQLAPIGPFEAGEHLVPIMPDRAVGGSRFTGTYWSQFVKGIPVYKSHLLVLVRNEPGFPAVLASSTLWDVSGIEASLEGIDPRVLPDARTWTRHALNQFRAQPRVSPAKYVIWAGLDRVKAEPRLAVQFTAEGGGHWDPDTHQHVEFVVDAKSGQVLHQHSLVCNAVEGRVTGLGTPGGSASICTAPAALALQYLAVQVDGTTVYSDVDGFYSAPDAAGTSAASASISGRYFDVRNTNDTAPISLSASVPQGAGWSPLFNATDDGTTAFDTTRAQVNVYHHANVIRDAVLRSNAEYPTIATQLGFRANVNIAATCNATYTGNAINFYAAGGGCSNTAFGTVVSHEFGHHAVATGGSLQGPYGEGMGDVFGIITSDESITGLGFQNCAGGIRDADNACQYDPVNCSSCGATVHSCGRLLSGFVWDLRGGLLASDPAGYRQYLADLAINSILLHGAVTTVDGAITIDFLTLDDDDAFLGNGTPNETAILNAGAQHGLLPPGLISFNSAIPELVPPDMPVTVGFRVRSLGESVIASSVRVLRYTDGQAVELVPTQVGLGAWEITFPGQACGTAVRFSVRAQTSQGTVLQSPENAPSSQLTMTFGTSVSSGQLAFDDLEAATSAWTVGAADDNATAGLWVRGDPIGTFNGGTPIQPEDDVTAAPGTTCWFTGQGTVGGGLGQADVDGGTTTLVSPNFGLAGANDPRVEFWAWYSNEGGQNPNSDSMPVEISADGGATWVTALTISENARAWVRREIRVEDFFPAPVAQVRVRFRARDLGNGSLVEAAIDDLRISAITVGCEPLTPADLNGDGLVDGADLGILLANWGGAGTGDLDDSGSVDGIDLGLLLGSWT